MNRFPVRQDLSTLPRVEDGWTFLYLERQQIDQENFGLRAASKDGVVSLPCSLFNVLMIGPGVTITSAAITMLADQGCSVIWVGENGVRFYANGSPKTNSSGNLQRQAHAWGDPQERIKVIRRMYTLRYGTDSPMSDNMATLRGHEGARVKQAYMDQAVKANLVWKARRWVRGQWDATDDLNKCLSVASSCVYGLCHAAIVAVGFSPALGFIHQGDMRSFVLDIADMYRESFTIPTAFDALVKCGSSPIESTVRRACRDAFRDQNMIGKIVPDIYEMLGVARVGSRFVDITAWESLKSKSA